MLPALAKMQKEKVKLDNEPVIDNLFPTFYGSGLVQGDLYLVFQVNLSWSLLLWSLFDQDIITGTGFRVTEKTEFHSIEQVHIFISLISCNYDYDLLLKVKLSLSSLGKFHAISHCFAAETRFRHQSRA